MVPNLLYCKGDISVSEFSCRPSQKILSLTACMAFGLTRIMEWANSDNENLMFMPNWIMG